MSETVTPGHYPRHFLVEIICDRCRRTIKGLDTGVYTAGFYKVTPGSYWEGFVEPGETKVCDDCMHIEPRYIAVYGQDVMPCKIVELDPTLDGTNLFNTMKRGDLVLDSYPNRVKVRGAYFKCPINGRVWGMNYAIHTIINRDPLTVSPSFVCPDGHHFWIRDGKAILI